MRLISLAFLTFALAGCGGGTNPGPSKDMAMSGGDMAMGGGGDMAMGGGGDDMAMGGMVDMTPSDGAKYFCMGFEQICGFSAMTYKDLATCLAAYDSYSINREMCVGNELGKSNCAAAAGGAPCDKN